MSPKPGVIPLRPLSLGDIFEGSVATIRGNPGATIGLAVILGLLICVPFMIAMIAISRTSIDDTFVRTTASLVTSYAARFVWYFVGLILTGMLISVLSEAVLGRRMTIGGAWSRCRPHVPALVGLTLLFLLIAVASVVLGVLAVAAVEASAGSTPAIISGVLIGIGWLLALVYCYVRVSLAAPAVVLERTGPLTALRRSWSLSKGQFWRILGITLLSALIVGVISGVLTTVVVFGTEMATLGSGGGTGSVLTATLGASTIAGTLISALLAPFQAGVTGLLYLDQRIRKEALDVSLMAAASQKSGVPR